MKQHFAELLLDARYRGASDVYRAKHPFSKDILSANAILFDPGISRTEKIDAYRRWLTTNQPCVFGRMAANNKQLFICLLEERDVLMMRHGDDDLRDTLQDYRQAWKRYALEGLTSAFIIVLVSKTIAHLEANDQLKELCRRFVELYLVTSPIPDDTIIPQREYVYLRRPGAKGASGYLKFATLPNIFAAQGDQRWWHDHRTPGGIMITSNPIGHFTYVKHPAATTLEAPQTTWALEHAMRTINAAYKPPKAKARWYSHCPATRLTPRAETEATPIKPQSDLHAFSPGAYGGYFHTDHLIPSVFFNPARDPASLPSYNDLSLRYLWDGGADPEDHAELVTGRPASAYDVTSSLARLPPFVNPEDPAAFTPPLRTKLRHWLERRLRERISA